MTDQVSRRTVLQVGTASAVAASLPLTMPALAHAEPAASRHRGPVPDLDSLAGNWMSVPDLQNLPAVTSERGSVKIGGNISSFQLATFPPLSQGAETLDLAVDGNAVQAEQSRWYPYQVNRRGHAGDVAVETSTRMLSDQNAVLVLIQVTNTSRRSRSVTLDLTTSTWLRTFQQKWDWQLPRPNDATPYRATEAGTHRDPAVIVADTLSTAVAAHAFTDTPDAIDLRPTDAVVTWHRKVNPGCRISIGVVVTAGTALATVQDASVRLARRFTATFARAHRDAVRRFHDAFTPGNGTYSGHLPTLDTRDRELSKLYYASIASVLQLQRSCFPAAPRVFPTAAPEWATSLTYFWDTSLWASVWSMLDPAMMRRQLPEWLALGITDGYAVDNLSRTLSGPWYAANDLSMFTLLRYYVDHTGDMSFLDQRVAGTTILQHMDAIATHWQSLVQPGQVLADYGEAYNLLEAVPTYIHQVPALNAANVWMMRRTAELHDRTGNPDRARELRELAAGVVRAVLQLYIDGEGVWACRNPDGSLVTVRHVYDYATIGEFMSENLSPVVREQMQHFLRTELLHNGWMRAMSLRDPNAAASDRPDHGPKGAYDGWPAHSAAASATMGDYPTALAMLRDAAAVTSEGPFSQSHEFVTEPQGVLVWDRDDLNPTRQLTVEAWVNARTWPVEVWRGSVVAKDTWGSQDEGYVLRGGDGGRISFAVALNGGFHEVSTTQRLSAGRWHHVAATYDGANMTIYLDGVVAATAAATGQLTGSPGANLFVATHPVDPGRVFDGSIDGVGVYGVALSAADVSARYANGSSSPAAGAVLYLPMNDGSGSTTGDAVTGTAYPVRAGRWTSGRSGSALDFDPATLAEEVRIAHRGGQDFNSSVSGSFAHVVIRNLFGYQPDGVTARLADPRAARGTDARLHNIPFRGRLYAITSDRHGLTLDARNRGH